MGGWSSSNIVFWWYMTSWGRCPRGDLFSRFFERFRVRIFRRSHTTTKQSQWVRVVPLVALGRLLMILASILEPFWPPFSVKNMIKSLCTNWSHKTSKKQQNHIQKTCDSSLFFGVTLLFGDLSRKRVLLGKSYGLRTCSLFWKTVLFRPTCAGLQVNLRTRTNT